VINLPVLRPCGSETGAVCEHGENILRSFERKVLCKIFGTALEYQCWGGGERTKTVKYIICFMTNMVWIFVFNLVELEGLGLRSEWKKVILRRKSFVPKREERHRGRGRQKVRWFDEREGNVMQKLENYCADKRKVAHSHWRSQVPPRDSVQIEEIIIIVIIIIIIIIIKNINHFPGQWIGRGGQQKCVSEVPTLLHVIFFCGVEPNTQSTEQNKEPLTINLSNSRAAPLLYFLWKRFEYVCSSLQKFIQNAKEYLGLCC